MSMSVVPRPFHNCRTLPADNLVTIDGTPPPDCAYREIVQFCCFIQSCQWSDGAGTPLPLAEISRRRSVVFAALDLDMSTPSAGQILSQLLLPVYGRARQGSSSSSVCGQGSGEDISSPAATKDLHELLLCCDTYIIILTKEPLYQCRELQRELAVAGESLSRSAEVPRCPTSATGTSSSPPRETSDLDGAHLLPGCIAIVHDEGAELLQSLQLVGLDGRTVPAVFKIASNEQLQPLADHAAATGELALNYRQFGLAYAGVQHSLEYVFWQSKAHRHLVCAYNFKRWACTAGISCWWSVPPLSDLRRAS